MTSVEGVPPSKHFRCITQRYVLRSPITQPNIPEEQVAYRQFPRPSLSREGVATRGYMYSIGGLRIGLLMGAMLYERGSASKHEQTYLVHVSLATHNTWLYGRRVL